VHEASKKAAGKTIGESSFKFITILRMPSKETLAALRNFVKEGSKPPCGGAEKN
jgi:hypothetical protein